MNPLMEREAIASAGGVDGSVSWRCRRLLSIFFLLEVGPSCVCVVAAPLVVIRGALYASAASRHGIGALMKPVLAVKADSVGHGAMSKKGAATGASRAHSNVFYRYSG